MKKILCILLCAALICPAALAQSYTFGWGDWGSSQLGSHDIMFNDEGELIATDDEYCDIWTISSEHGWFDAILCQRNENGDHQPGGDALMNADGEVLTAHKYAGFAEASADRIIAYREDDSFHYFYGVLNEKGEEVIPLQYEWLGFFGKDHFYTSGENDRLVVFDRDGNAAETQVWLSNKIYGFGGPVQSTDAPLVPACMEPGGAAGYVGPDGNWVIAPQYSTADHFSDGYASVSKDGLYGLIDAQGATVIPLKYDWYIRIHHSIIAQIPHSDRHDVYSLDGKFLFSYDGKLEFCGEGFYAPDENLLLDKDGKIVDIDLSDCELVYSEWPQDDGHFMTLQYSDGTQKLLRCDYTLLDIPYSAVTYGAQTADGHIYIACTETAERHEGFNNCWCTPDRYGLIDQDGNPITPCEYYLMEPISGSGYFLYEDETGYGVMDAAGNSLFYRDCSLDRHQPVWG